MHWIRHDKTFGLVVVSETLDILLWLDDKETKYLGLYYYNIDFTTIPHLIVSMMQMVVVKKECNS